MGQKWTQEDTENLNKKYLCDKGEKKNPHRIILLDLAQGPKALLIYNYSYVKMLLANRKKKKDFAKLS